MSIKRLSKDQFDALNPARGPMARTMATEKAWFADDAQNVIGVILLDHADNDWNYVILGRDQHETFRWIDGESSFSRQEEAEKKLTAAMSKLETSGKTVFPQGQ